MGKTKIGKDWTIAFSMDSEDFVYDMEIKMANIESLLVTIFLSHGISFNLTQLQ